ncbi:alpha/beta hydrolase [Sphingomonas paeninsulae]|jgi:pimeloyl-ACP methyl ester carboxylesterase|uniref:Alpha/beta hydrolase n=1 Tax=Sphingomonas paeninsulae TaxID=2319844 RepID=A0A494TL98_SPHPE|nr:alpha/beta hydrolase [Sphingomonas paeninsulae]AYJ85885.1 alpha/beta hydrolase [Sphingomonas paeninsulae]
MLPSATSLPGERRGYVDGPCGQVHYREQGTGQPIILIHQAPWSSIQYRHAIPLLAAKGYRVIAPDLPGHGMSNPPSGDPSVELYAEAVAAIINALDLNPVVVIGHHGGALVAARLAAEHADKVGALVTDNMPYYNAAQRIERLTQLSDVQEIKPDGSHFTDRWEVVRRIADPEWSDETVHLGLVTYFANGPWKEHGHRAAPAYDPQLDLDRIICPVLVISSVTDRLFPMGQMIVARKPDWDYAELPGGAGMVFERSSEWAAPILGFIASHAGHLTREVVADVSQHE